MLRVAFARFTELEIIGISSSFKALRERWLFL